MERLERKLQQRSTLTPFETKALEALRDLNQRVGRIEATLVSHLGIDVRTPS